MKTAGGCGVVPFWSVERIFSFFHDCCISKRMCRYQAVSNRESWSLNAQTTFVDLARGKVSTYTATYLPVAGEDQGKLSW